MLCRLSYMQAQVPYWALVSLQRATRRNDNRHVAIKVTHFDLYLSRF